MSGRLMTGVPGIREIVVTTYCVAALGTTLRATCAPRTATGAASKPTSSGSVWPGHFHKIVHTYLFALSGQW